MKRRMSVTVRGRQHEWSFPFAGDEKHLQEWRDDGLEVVIVENTVPMLVAELGLVRPWCWCQDFWQWVRLW